MYFIFFLFSYEMQCYGPLKFKLSVGGYIIDLYRYIADWAIFSEEIRSWIQTSCLCLDTGRGTYPSSPPIFPSFSTVLIVNPVPSILPRCRYRILDPFSIIFGFWSIGMWFLGVNGRNVWEPLLWWAFTELNM